jgi:hypothetical protein
MVPLVALNYSPPAECLTAIARLALGRGDRIVALTRNQTSVDVLVKFCELYNLGTEVIGVTSIDMAASLAEDPRVRAIVHTFTSQRLEDLASANPSIRLIRVRFEVDQISRLAVKKTIGQLLDAERTLEVMVDDP